MAQIVGAHLVGSAPVADPAEMFDLAVSHLGGHLRRLGDGEVGERDTWIRWQYARLGRSPELAATFTDTGYGGRPIEQFALKPGAGPVTLPDLGYADAAMSSYEVFARRKAAGAIPPHVRFMVGLPTPLGVVTLYGAPGSRAAVLAAYQPALLAELSRITAALPHDQLAIQWEVCIEFGILEGIWDLLDDGARGADAKPAIAAHLAELGAAVPAGVEVGYHLCYGDAGHTHFTQPGDAGLLAWATRAIVDGVRRPVQWVHLPVPRERDDVAYFQPLAGLELPTETELYLGLVHATGGLEATRRRIAAAAQVLDRFGVATECGLGRRPPDTIPALLDQHAAVAHSVVGPTAAG
jgi:hypothetical protein